MTRCTHTSRTLPYSPPWGWTALAMAALIIGPPLARAESKAAQKAHRDIFAAPTAPDGSAPSMPAYEGARTCARCHEFAGFEVARALHYQLQAPAANVPGHETSALGLLNGYCGMQGTVASFNWLTLVEPAGGQPEAPVGCAQCHVGTGPKPTPLQQLSQADYDSVDCLICHAPGYSRTVVSEGGALKFVPAPGVDLAQAVQGVRRPTSDMCLRCHLSAGGGPNFKHGTVPTPLSDVHAARGVECVDCHVTTGHHTAGPGDLKAVDAPGVDVDCTRCHTSAPHRGDGAFNNTHTSRVACQTCHIPSVAVDPALPTVVERDWTRPTLNPSNGLYEASNRLAANVRPVYAWWNGKLQLQTSVPLGSIRDPDSKIHPWKTVTILAPADAVRPETPVPLDSAVYAVSGDVGRATASGASQINTPYSGNWTPHRNVAWFAAQHQVAPASQALGCASCHVASGGRLDFAALGYDSNRVAFLQSTAPWQGRSHVGRLGAAYHGPASCTQCHSGKTEEVMDSAHYTMRTPNPNVAYPGGGSHGMVDLFSGFSGGGTMANYFADLSSSSSAFGCGKCHIGKDLPLPNAATGQFTQAQKDGLDCLICHAADDQYDMNGDGVRDAADSQATARVLTTDANTGRKVWHQDRSLTAAESVGYRVSTGACLRCHQHGQAAADYKRGTPYDERHDVHAAAGLRCTDCHKVAGHKIARGAHVADLHAWERQDVAVTCANCHTSRPHPEWPDNPAFVPYNEHAKFISCQACHIPWVSGLSRRIWASPEGVPSGPEADLPKQDPVTGLFEPYSAYTPQYATRPVYRWFSGASSMFAEPLHDPAAWDFRIADRATPGAMIYPFRNFVNGLAVDARGIEGLPAFDPQHTMAGALETSSESLRRFGFMRPEGLTDRERAAAAKLPHLLTFDLQIYQREGDVAKAADLGLGRTGAVLSGSDPARMSHEQITALGASLWSGDLTGMDLPENPLDPKYNGATDPTLVTGSFVSVNHAVDRVQAFKCQDCHSQTGVMDFGGLGYTPAQDQWLRTMFDVVQFISLRRTPAGLQIRWSSKPGKTYQLLSTGNLNAGTWIPLSAPRYTVSVWMQHDIPAAAMTNSGQTYFRVQELPR